MSVPPVLAVFEDVNALLTDEVAVIMAGSCFIDPSAAS
jgi:hypothetical protein